ncbi:MAG: ComF family protein, partial [Desulfuromonas sp.]|nr:ComF family protein [Desulfuromonas sp.]
GAKLDISVDTRHLIRTRPTSSQTKLNLTQRRQNIHGAFSIGASLSARRILLVDDVVTTTATCRECAKVLAQAGHQVAIVALSRASLQL